MAFCIGFSIGFRICGVVGVVFGVLLAWALESWTDRFGFRALAFRVLVKFSRF